MTKSEKKKKNFRNDNSRNRKKNLIFHNISFFFSFFVFRFSFFVFRFFFFFFNIFRILNSFLNFFKHCDFSFLNYLIFRVDNKLL